MVFAIVIFMMNIASQSTSAHVEWKNYREWGQHDHGSHPGPVQYPQERQSSPQHTDTGPYHQEPVPYDHEPGNNHRGPNPYPQQHQADHPDTGTYHQEPGPYHDEAGNHQGPSQYPQEHQPNPHHQDAGPYQQNPGPYQHDPGNPPPPNQLPQEHLPDQPNPHHDGTGPYQQDPGPNQQGPGPYQAQGSTLYQPTHQDDASRQTFHQDNFQGYPPSQPVPSTPSYSANAIRTVPLPNTVPSEIPKHRKLLRQLSQQVLGPDFPNSAQLSFLTAAPSAPLNSQIQDYPQPQSAETQHDLPQYIKPPPYDAEQFNYYS